MAVCFRRYLQGRAVSDNRSRSQEANRQTFDGERFSVQLTQTLFNWQAFAARSQAYLIEDQLEAEYYGELANLLTEVAEKYFNVLQSEDALESIASELEAVSNQLDQIQSLYDRQLARVTDLYQVQASLAAVEGATTSAAGSVGSQQRSPVFCERLNCRRA